MEPNPQFATLADDQAIDRATASLTANGFEVMVVANGPAAKDEVLRRLPAGAQVFTMQSQTVKAIGLAAEIDESGRYDSVRKKLMALDPKTQGKEQRILGAVPDWTVGSVHAVSESGHLFVASNTGSQLGAYAYGAGRVIFVVGTQKIVPDDPTAGQRLQEYSLPLEDQRLFQARGVHSSIRKVLVFMGEAVPGRVSVILVREKLGF